MKAGIDTLQSTLPSVTTVDELVGFIRRQMPLGMKMFAGFSPEQYRWTNAHTQVIAGDGLAERVRKVSQKGAFDGFASENHQWTNRHLQVDFKGEVINVKYATLAGYGLITLLRPLAEQLWNEGYLVYQGPEASMIREHETLVKLREAGFPTFESLQELILDKHGKPIVPRVLLTHYETGTTNAVDILSERNIGRSVGLMLEGFSLVKRLHSLGVTVSDPWWGNFLEVRGRLWHGDYGFLVNHSHSDELVHAREVAQLVISGVYRSGLGPAQVAQIARNGYAGIEGLRTALEHIIAYDEHHLSGPLTRPFRNILFQKTVFGLDQEKTLGIKKELLKQLC